MLQPQTVLIPDGEHELALRVIRCLAHQTEVEIHVLSTNPSAPIRLSRHTSGFHVCNTGSDDHARVAAIADAAKRTRAQVILPVAIPTIRLVAEHRHELSAVAALPPLPTLALLDIFDDKWLLAQLLASENIPHPKTYSLAQDPLDLRRLKGIKFPLMVKARTRNAGGGICLCRNPDEVVNFLSKQNDREEFFLQEFATGQDVDVSVLCQNGEILAYTIQRGLIPSHKPFHPPAAIEFIYDDATLQNVQRLVRAVKWSGIVHFDCIYDPKSRETKILEANPRYWRSLPGSLKAGVNFPYLAYLTAKGYEFECPSYRSIRYARPQAALRMLAQGWSNQGISHWHMRDFGFAELLRDPLPDLAIQTGRVAEKLLR
jgi:predicted ATP-grasp superfamily ATP-dependent carboligase